MEPEAFDVLGKALIVDTNCHQRQLQAARRLDEE